MMMKKTGILLMLLVGGSVFAQQNVHPQSETYQWPTDPLVREKLDKWQDRKFGMIIHWGLYSVPGMIESWALCSEPWIERDSTIAYNDFKNWYWGLNKEFNPVKFDPDAWASAGKSAGMKYLVFTTKHHDGFAMFNTKETDFNIAAGPFKNNPKADVAKFVFDAFRRQGFMIGAYFSKPDWHSPYYWWPKYATANRNNNYDIRTYPWRWNMFKQFTFNQINELMHNYGQVDILWLDGGWVRPLETVNDEVKAWGAPIPAWSQDIDMPKIAAMARQAQPGILMVDRTVHGRYENYQTPEQHIPDTQLDHPWESCLTLGNDWGFVPKDQYKSAAKIIHTLVEVTAKGGSLLLGVGPKPDGTFPDEVTARLAEIGRWLDVNGKAIYNTRSTKIYHEGATWFTADKNKKTLYAITCVDEENALPTSISWKGNAPKKGGKVFLIQNNQSLKWETNGDKTTVILPASFKETTQPAVAISFEIE